VDGFDSTTRQKWVVFLIKPLDTQPDPAAPQAA
jgi:hypothetical protein